MAQTSDFEPFIIEVDCAEGVYIFDKNNKKYFDFLSGMSVNHLGHKHPRIIEAAVDQMNKYMHVMAYGEFIQEPQIKLAEKLASLLPPSLQMTYFVNSGSEAMEGAIKLAKLHTHRSEIISFRNSYHGSTIGAMSVVGNENFKQHFGQLLPHTKLFDYNDLSVIDAISEKTCCVIVEPIQSGSGMQEGTLEFLQSIKNACQKYGALLIYDEIQSGLGRTGKLFAFEHSGITPDILCIAKSLGAGFPLGAFISSPEIMKSMDNGHPLLGHASTFGGHPVACAAASALLDIVANQDFLANVEKKGNLIKKLFVNDAISEIKGKGLFLAAWLNQPEKIETYVKNCIQNGLLTFWLLFNKKALELVPPLIISEEEITESAILFNKSLS